MASARRATTSFVSAAAATRSAHASLSRRPPCSSAATTPRKSGISSTAAGGHDEPDRTVPPAQLINGPTVIISGPALLEVSALLQLGIKHLKVRDAIAPPPRLLAIAGLVKQAADQYRAMSYVGPRPRTSRPDPASSSQADPHEVTANQAAQMLGITDRHVRRLASQLGIVRVKPLMFSTAAVEAYASRRQTERRRTAA
jgi:hypothetical protein